MEKPTICGECAHWRPEMYGHCGEYDKCAVHIDSYVRPRFKYCECINKGGKCPDFKPRESLRPGGVLYVAKPRSWWRRLFDGREKKC